MNLKYCYSVVTFLVETYSQTLINKLSFDKACLLPHSKKLDLSIKKRTIRFSYTYMYKYICGYICE